MCKPEALSKEKDAMQAEKSKQQRNDGGENDQFTVTTASVSSSVLSGVLHGVVWTVFSLNFPILLSGKEVYSKIYQSASFEYDPRVSVFDNTVWTYGTDYALATMTAFMACWILRTSNRAKNSIAKRLSRISAAMLVLYSIQTACGGLAHHNFLTVESRNSLAFRVLWTICVGAVFVAAAAMGMIGTECLELFQLRSNCPPLLKTLPRPSHTYWVFYGAIGTIACICGASSFQRPACDIFIAGTTQTPSTFYCMLFLYLVEHPKITNTIKILGLFGFIQNAFLLPLYPILVLNFGWSLPATNTLLHTNLFCAWFLQALALQRIVKALVEETGTEAGLQKQQPTITASNNKKVQ